MSAGIPASAAVVIVGAGIHGLSAARALGADALVLEKSRVGAGASGVACGVVRNNYHQPAMRKLMAHSVDLWERDAAALSYHSVGYLQVSMESMRADVREVARQQAGIGYESVFVEGEAETRSHMRGVFPDWRAEGVTSVLHEKRGGYANNQASLSGLAKRARENGARILEGVAAAGFAFNSDGSVAKVKTDRGDISCGQVLVAAGPWTRDLWAMLELPDSIPVARDGAAAAEPMWRYFSLQEGVLGVPPDFLARADGAMPPVTHVDSDAPLRSEKDGRILRDAPWGIYYKPDFHFNGVQGGASPREVRRPAAEVAVDPYGPDSPEFVVGEDFAEMWVSALAHCQSRFAGQLPNYRREPSGGVGCFTADNFPVFDLVRPNAYVVADSNHGYKMLGVGALAAGELRGKKSELLEPFRLSRFAAGNLHPASNSPFPWS